MKKYIAFLLCLVMLLTLASCTVQNDGNKSPQTESGTESGVSEMIGSYPVTKEQAWSLANEYWDGQNGSRDQGAGTVWTAKITVSDTPSQDGKYYTADFLVEWRSNVGRDDGESAEPYDVQVMDRILINAFTGEITTPEAEAAGGKCISVEEAIEVAKASWEYIDFDSKENEYRVELDTEAIAPEHIYVIVVWKISGGSYFYEMRRWVDKYSGKVIFEYYMFGK